MGASPTLWVDVNQTQRKLKELLEALEETPFKNDFPIVARAFCMLTHCSPFHPDIEKWRDTALSGFEKWGDMELAALTLCSEVNYCLAIAQPAKATVAADSLKALSSTKEASGRVVLLSLLAQATLYNFTGEVEACKTKGAEGLALLTATGAVGAARLEFPFRVQLACTALAENDLKSAKTQIARLEESPQAHLPGNFSRLQFLKGLQALGNRQLQLAQTHAQSAIDSGQKTGGFDRIATASLLKAHVLIELGDYRSAETLIREVRERADYVQPNIYTFMCQTAAAFAAVKKGGIEPGLKESLKELFSFSRQRGIAGSPLWRSSVMASLCLQALTFGIETQTVLDLVKQRKLEPKAPPVTMENWPWQVRIYTLGRLEIVRGDDPIRFTNKAQKRPLELLGALIEAGARKVDGISLALELWPDADGDCAQQSLSVTLHRLRKLLGTKEAILVENGLVSLNHRKVWLDTWAFLRLIGEAEKAQTSSAAAQKALEAIDHFNGPFMGRHQSESPSTTFEQRLLSRLEKGVRIAGDFLEKMERWNEAEQLYEKAALADSSCELHFRKLINCQLRRGNRSQALRTFERCKKSMELLGEKPSRLTVSIIEEARQDS